MDDFVKYILYGTPFRYGEVPVAPVTVTVHVADAVPHVAVIVATPVPTAVTTPFATVATAESLVFQVTVPEAVAVEVI